MCNELAGPGVYPGEYAYVKERLLPALVQMREQGRIRSIGITERFPSQHTTRRSGFSSRCLCSSRLARRSTNCLDFFSCEDD
jgi:hypothetical protein